MAVQVWKDGESQWIKPKGLAAAMAAGWSPEDPNAPPPVSHGSEHIGHLPPIDPDSDEMREIVLGKMHIKVR